jgi:DNA-binding NarL/FixJ family response regulator
MVEVKKRSSPRILQIPLGEESRGGGVSSVRVLIVEDFVPFQQFLCSELAQRPELRVVGIVSDGLKAVQKAEELHPDLILLDIGLPTLNGIDAARQIRSLASGSKILFVSQESSPDVVQEALCWGQGYLVKTRVASELLAAVKAVLEGRAYVSTDL